MTRPAPLVLVLGMHRSGTSLLGGVLQRLGVALPGEVIPGDESNPEGYFEWREVVDLQERLLIDLERWWPSAEGTQALPDGWLQHPATQAVRQQLRQLLLQEQTRQVGEWAVKDPRTSRLLPLWLELSAELELPLQLLLAVRHPAEVVCSLVHRDGPLTGMDPNRAQQLWWRHNLEVVEAAQAATLPFTVIDFGRWFTAPKAQLQALIDALPDLHPSELNQQHALELVRPEHRRSLQQADDAGLFPPVRRLHQKLLRHPLPSRWPSSSPPRSLQRATEMTPMSDVSASSPQAWSDWLQSMRHHPAPRLSQPPQCSNRLQISCCGLSWSELAPHAWLRRLPLPQLGGYELVPELSSVHQLTLQPLLAIAEAPPANESLERLTINLELPAPERASHWLEHLQAQQLIWDPLPARVLLLRALGLPAWWLDPSLPANGWLNQPLAADPSSWAEQLGFAEVQDDDLLVLGDAGPDWNRALAAEWAAEQSLEPSIDYRPGWPELIVNSPVAGLARAGWLAAAQSAASRVFFTESVVDTEDLLAFDEGGIPPMLLPSPTSPAELRGLHCQQPLMALAEDRWASNPACAFHWQSELKPQAAVLVSLFNYGDRIVAALESARQQRHVGLELIVVDDASSDQSVDIVHDWMQRCQLSGNHPFVRMQLMQHQENAGLAAARNTAFSAAQAPWCFVLDADNALFPQAVSASLQLAETGSERLAVVHPLLAVEASPGRPDEQRTLVRPQSWQAERFLFENNVDAMALVRRKAWEVVGGYTHIEGGWEDYDFWCKLVSAGFYGVQSPRVLAVYRSHAESMSHTATNRSWRALSRTLQMRHPWLQLPLASL